MTDSSFFALVTRSRLPAAALAAAGVFCLAERDGPAPAPAAPADPCGQVAQTALQAELTGARADYLLAVGKCQATGGALGSCLTQLREDYHEARAEVRAVHRERLKVCALLGGGPYNPSLDPGQFTTQIANPYLPWIPGRTLVYQKQTAEGLETIRVTTQAQTVQIAGIDCVVVRDVVDLDGELIEDTDDWFAQGLAGDVWYIGEIALNYEDGMLDNLDGSWRTGKDGALPGVVMGASPQVGDAYRQEFLLGEAEDLACVVQLGATVVVPAGTFGGCVVTEDFTPLEPGVSELKYYAPGIGLVLEVDQDGGRTELVQVIDP